MRRGAVGDRGIPDEAASAISRGISGHSPNDQRQGRRAPGRESPDAPTVSTMRNPSTHDRRTFLVRAAAFGGATAFAPLLPAWAQSGTQGLRPDMPTLSGEDIALRIGHRPFTVGRRTRREGHIKGTD